MYKEGWPWPVKVEKVHTSIVWPKHSPHLSCDHGTTETVDTGCRDIILRRSREVHGGQAVHLRGQVHKGHFVTGGLRVTKEAYLNLSVAVIMTNYSTSFLVRCCHGMKKTTTFQHWKWPGMAWMAECIHCGVSYMYIVIIYMYVGLSRLYQTSEDSPYNWHWKSGVAEVWVSRALASQSFYYRRCRVLVQHLERYGGQAFHITHCEIHLEKGIEFSKRLDPSLPFFYHTSSHDRFYEGERPSFDVSAKSKRNPRNQRIRSVEVVTDAGAYETT